MDAELARGSTLIAIVFREDCLKVRALELSLRHVERDAFPDHFDDEVMQQFAHRKASRE